MNKADAERQLDAYGRACVALHQARINNEPATAVEEWAEVRAEIRRFLVTMLTNQPEPTFPPVSGGSPEMDDDNDDICNDCGGPVIDTETYSGVGLCEACADIMDARSNDIEFIIPYKVPLGVSGESHEANDDVERVWQEYWLPLVSENGLISMAAIKAELFDYHTVLQEVSAAYYEITNGRFSKPNTAAVHITSAVEEATEQAVAEALANAFPPVSGGSDLPEMDDDEIACGELCQDRNDAAWARLGPVDDVELPF